MVVVVAASPDAAGASVVGAVVGAAAAMEALAWLTSCRASATAAWYPPRSPARSFSSASVNLASAAASSSVGLLPSGPTGRVVVVVAASDVPSPSTCGWPVAPSWLPSRRSARAWSTLSPKPTESPEVRATFLRV